MKTNTPTSGRGWAALGLSFGLITAGGAAHAQSSIEMYGLIGVYAGSMQRSDAQVRTQIVGAGGMTTSYYGFRGKEDLGGGVKAIFQLENFFQPDNGGGGRSANDPQGFSRSAWVGLEGAFGRLSAGRHGSQFYLAMQSVNPFQASVVFAPVVLHSYIGSYGSTLSGDTAWNNVVQYSSPDMGGLGVTVQHGVGEVAGDSSVANDGIHVSYKQGKFNLAVAAQRVEVDKVAPSTGQTSYLVGGAYDFGPLKLFASAQSSQRSVTDIKSRTYQLGTSVPAGAMSKWLLSAARTTVRNPLRPEIERTTVTLGYDHALSKRTDVYAILLYDKLRDQPRGTTPAVGLRHLF